MFRSSLFRRCAAAASAAAPSADTATSSSAELTPRQVVEVLDKYIVGQESAKKAVSVALRNRWRRNQLKDKDLKDDVTPKNILMIGPTGVGKTEIARRMAKLTDAPFVKVEATKYTEVGFKGKDVESMIEDLFSAAKTRARGRLEKTRQKEAIDMAHDVVLAALIKLPEFTGLSQEDYKKKLDAGELAAVNIPVTVSIAQPSKSQSNPDVLSLDAFGVVSEPKMQKQTLTKPVPEALELAKNEAFLKLIDDNQVAVLAKTLAEQDGIVFIDEIDKVVADAAAVSNDVSSLGVQQDLLPLIEGSTVTLKDGSTTIDTSTILFICSGAFHVVKPSDMIAELQGRLPVRVELKALKEAEFRRILVEPKFNLLKQQIALMKAENITMEFNDDGINALAKVAAEINTNAQNIGARRLHTIIERVMEDLSFNCDKHEGETKIVDDKWVDEATKPMRKSMDLAKYLL